MAYFRVSKAGYGSLKEVQEFSAREMLQAMHFEKFNDDFERTYAELNKNGAGN